MVRNHNYLILMLAILVTALAGCKPAGPTKGPIAQAGLTDTQFATQAFTKLADGDQSVASDIEWEKFNTPGGDTPAKYNAVSGEDAKEAFRTAFISSFSKAFKGTGATPGMIKNWKETGTAGDTVTITGEGATGAHMNLTVSKTGGIQKLIGIGAG